MRCSGTQERFRDYSALALSRRLVLLTQADLGKVLRLALGMHTNSARYLKTMEKAPAPESTWQSIVAEVPDGHHQHASEVIRERFKKDAERRKALREAEALEKPRAAIGESTR